MGRNHQCDFVSANRPPHDRESSLSHKLDLLVLFVDDFGGIQDRFQQVAAIEPVPDGGQFGKGQIIWRQPNGTLTMWSPIRGVAGAVTITSVGTAPVGYTVFQP